MYIGMMNICGVNSNKCKTGGVIELAILTCIAPNAAPNPVGKVPGVEV